MNKHGFAQIEHHWPIKENIPPTWSLVSQWVHGVTYRSMGDSRPSISPKSLSQHEYECFIRGCACNLSKLSHLSNCYYLHEPGEQPWKSYKLCWPSEPSKFPLLLSLMNLPSPTGGTCFNSEETTVKHFLWDIWSQQWEKWLMQIFMHLLFYFNKSNFQQQEWNTHINKVERLVLNTKKNKQ